jgi:hypothetical protein
MELPPATLSGIYDPGPEEAGLLGRTDILGVPHHRDDHRG